MSVIQPSPFVRMNVTSGAPLLPGIALDSFAWQIILDARSITGVAEGGSVNTWPNTGLLGSASDAVKAALQIAPLYRGSGSLKGLPLVDFSGSVHNLTSALPLAGFSQANGFTLMAYIAQDVVDPNDGGGFNAQSIVGAYTGTDYRLYSVIYPAPTTPQVGGRTSGAGDQGSGATAVVGIHTEALVCRPPTGVTGVVREYRDGSDIGGWLNWNSNPNTSFIYSGNTVGNIWFKGKIGWLAFGDFALTAAQINGLDARLRFLWG